MRLRTITHEWSSDEEHGKQHIEDLRQKIKVRVASIGISCVLKVILYITEEKRI